MIELIRCRFVDSGLSMKALSDRAGVPYASVHGIFKGNRDPALSTVERLSKVLGLELRATKRRKH